jgi:Protein of unknown function (DUF3592)
LKARRSPRVATQKAKARSLAKLPRKLRGPSTPSRRLISDPNHVQRWIPRVLFGLAALLLATGAATLVDAARFVRGAERTTGTVIDLDARTSDGDLVYYPMVRFTTAGGRRVEFTSSSGSSSPPDVGDRVEVLYDPDDPQDAQLSGFFSLWLWPIVLGGVGIGFAAAGLFYPRTGPFARRRRRSGGDGDAAVVLNGR